MVFAGYTRHPPHAEKFAARTDEDNMTTHPAPTVLSLQADMPLSGKFGQRFAEPTGNIAAIRVLLGRSPLLRVDVCYLFPVQDHVDHRPLASHGHPLPATSSSSLCFSFVVVGPMPRKVIAFQRTTPGLPALGAKLSLDLAGCLALLDSDFAGFHRCCSPTSAFSALIPAFPASSTPPSSQFLAGLPGRQVVLCVAGSCPPATHPKGKAYLHHFRKTSLQHALEGEDVSRSVAADARLGEGVLVTSYTTLTDRRLRAMSDRTYRRILLSLPPEVARRYGYVEGDSQLEEQEQVLAAVAAGDWKRVSELSAKLAQQSKT